MAYIYNETIMGIENTEDGTGVAMVDRKSAEYFIWLLEGNGDDEARQAVIDELAENSVPVDTITPLPQQSEVWQIGVVFGLIDPAYPGHPNNTGETPDIAAALTAVFGGPLT
jgi:hypothetical protein